MNFDPDAAGKPGSGIFGLPTTRQEARIVLLPVPFDATTSYGNGTAGGPAAIFDASMQVDLYDRRFGRVYEKGIYMEPESEKIAGLSARVRELAEPIIEKGGAEESDRAVAKEIDAAGEEVNRFVYEHTKRVIAEGKIAGLVGGDHSTPFGAIRACAEAAGQLGILHLDAHMDLRKAYEGFTWSHASIMYNVLTRVPQVTKLVQIGLRDFGEGEMDFGIEQGTRYHAFYDDVLTEEAAAGTRSFTDLAREAVAMLPERVYVSFDIDALDPSLCPHTGTPVPGGLAFNQAYLLLDALKQSGKKIVGFDLVEVCAGEDGEWDANVGARVLYKLCGACA